MNITIGIVMLCIGLGMIFLALPRKGEGRRPFLQSPLVYAVYPALILVFLAMGILTAVMNL
jgi:sulfite exporter TauE/SafE